MVFAILYVTELTNKLRKTLIYIGLRIAPDTDVYLLPSLVSVTTFQPSDPARSLFQRQR